MSALTAVPRQVAAAHGWFDQHLDELTSRAKGFARRFPRSEREEAVAEIIAMILGYTLRAADRGLLPRLTVFTLVSFFGRSYAAGRQLTGTCNTDVLSALLRRRNQNRVISLNQPVRVRTARGEAELPLSEVLADRKSQQPVENCRRDTDYEEILGRQRRSTKIRRVFRFLAETHGEGQQTELARTLRVVPSRVTALKQRLAVALAAGGYAPSGWEPSRREYRSRRGVPPLNAGTSPAPILLSP